MPRRGYLRSFSYLHSCQESSIWLTQTGSGGLGFHLLVLSLFLVPRYQLPLNWGGEGKLQSPLIKGFWTSSFSIYGLDIHLLVGVALRE